MNETQRTLAFVGVAVVSLLAAVFAAPTINDPLADMNLGTEFYPDFQDPTEAASLTVVVFNDEMARRQQFVVENHDGHWRIPSHNNYPADAAERLAKTAASLIGIKRDGFQSNSPQSHEALGVISPLDDESTSLKGRGDLLILKDADGNKLVDFIIGKPVEGREGYYYVRKEDSNAVYISKLDIDLSTKFSDWVETDLLKMNSNDLTLIEIQDYSIDEAKMAIKEGETSLLARENSSDPWTLAGLEDETKELDTAKVNAMISAMDNLKLIGVRKKPEGISKDLKLSEDITELTQSTASDLISRGFFPTQFGLKSNEGELIATTNKGVEYVLRFGEIFTGSDLEIEAGIEKNEKAAAEEEKEAEGDAKPEAEKKDDEKQGRFLFAFARFNEDALGPKPVEPQKPEEKSAEDEEPADQEKGEEPAAGDDKAEAPADEQKAEEEKSEGDDAEEEAKPETEKSDDEKPAEGDKPEEEQPDPQAEYKKALAKFKTDLAAYEKKVEEGKKQVEDLNRRFADWYYVISEEAFKEIRLHRPDLIKDKAEEGEQTPPPGGNIPGLPGGLNLNQ